MPAELLQQVRLVDPSSETDRIADVLIADGVVQAVAGAIADYPEDTIVRSGSGMLLAPGLVDLYSHSGEPGFEERETLGSLLAAAAAGGFTRVAVLPTTNPPLDNPASVAWLLKQAATLKEKSMVPTPVPHLHCWAALTVDVQGQRMTELAELAEAGVIGFADGRSLSNWSLVRRLLEYVRPLAKPVALWACDAALTGNGVMREGQASIQLGLPGVPAIAETVALAALLECVEAIGTPVHLMRVSTARGVELIRQAKAKGLPITASVSWAHLLLNTEALGRYDPNLRFAPPLGNPSDQIALRQGLRDGVLDAIAIDHTPYAYEEKTVAFAEAPAGVIGLELALPLLWQDLVTSGEWSALQLWQRLSTQPAQCLNLPANSIAPGQPAELVLFDPSASWKVEERSLKSLSSNTPWLEQDIQGRVIKIWC